MGTKTLLRGRARRAAWCVAAPQAGVLSEPAVCGSAAVACITALRWGPGHVGPHGGPHGANCNGRMANTESACCYSCSSGAGCITQAGAMVMRVVLQHDVHHGVCTRCTPFLPCMVPRSYSCGITSAPVPSHAWSPGPIRVGSPQHQCHHPPFGTASPAAPFSSCAHIMTVISLQHIRVGIHACSLCPDS